MRSLNVVILSTLGLCASLSAQSVAGLGAISGTVRDATGSTVPDAQVTVSNDAIGVRRTVNSTDAGVFGAPSLPPAAGYSVTVSKAGFTPFRVENIQVQVGQAV